MTSFFRISAGVCLLIALTHGPVAAQSATGSRMPQEQSSRQDPALIRQVAEQFLETQAAGLPGQVTVKMNQVDARLNLAACAALEPFMAAGSRAWGKTTVGVRCAAPSPWTVYVAGTVQVMGSYLVTAAPVAQGQVLGQQDIAKMTGDLTALPAGILTEPAQAIGRTVVNSLGAGMPLRQDALRNQQAVAQGQLIRLVTAGPGFKVSAEGRALANGADGQVVQARTASGQVVSGVARVGGIVEVTY